MSESELIVQRFENPRARFTLAEDMFVERGTSADWELLHDLHYKAEKLPFAPKFWRLVIGRDTIGVLVTGAPKGMLRERHLVFPKLKPTGQDTKLTNTNRFVYLNKNFRVISRFVVDTMYRGIGAGYRMMNLVSRMEAADPEKPLKVIEIQSSMSKFNIFGQKAGFQFAAPQNANKYDAGMKFFRSHFQATPQDFEAIVKEIEASADPEKLAQACRDFYLRNSAMENTGAARDKAQEKVAAMSVRDLVKGIQQVSLASPMYGVWKAVDQPGTVPDRLPLLAFDCQKTSEPLKWKP
ncbi:hypothetical protein HJB53_30430 [Rhizobium lentis]|uniref:hypothetical protein n=1 Tax=Rhizobium lentis TaxID=1138194 RepID=UPI001C828618|nr:hypothetical protein [Rhizobium lentis]MBX5130810.1 hypothetical protein [Rhizobium lentis]